MSIELRAFQRAFIRGATAPGIDTAALSLPRGNGKSWLGGHLIARILDPADKLFRPGTESVLLAASIEQARVVFRFARDMLGEDGYRYLDSATRCAITSRFDPDPAARDWEQMGKTAMGLVNTPWAICDEPGRMGGQGGRVACTMRSRARRASRARRCARSTSGLWRPPCPGWWHDMIARRLARCRHTCSRCRVTRRRGTSWHDDPQVRIRLPRYRPTSGESCSQERDAARRDTQFEG